MVRAVSDEDVSAISAIYAHYVRETAITFDLEAPSEATWRERVAAGRRAGYPWLVAEEDGVVLGFAYGGAFRSKAAYARTVETTIYLAASAGGRGRGRALYDALLAQLAEGFHLAVAGMTLPNPASEALHARCGFTRVGVFAEVGRKFGAWHDVVFFEKRL